MSLRKLFALIALLLAALMLALLGRIVSNEWSRVREARQGLEAMQNLRLVLLAAEMASRERGPANGVLGDDMPGDPAKRARLAQSRQRSDQALDALVRSLQAGAGDTALAQVGRARATLAEGRAMVDRTAALPRTARRDGDLREAIERMFRVIAELMPCVMDFVQASESAHPRQSGAINGAMLAAVLREYAGQLGSQFTVSLTHQQSLRDEERFAIERLRGRIEQLRGLLDTRTRSVLAREPVARAFDGMKARYFESAMPYVDAQIRIGVASGRYGIDTAQFAARYVPDMDSIVELRDALLAEALRDAQATHDAAGRALAVALAAGLLALGVLAFTLHQVNHRVVRPVVETTELMTALARGDLRRDVPMPRFNDEVAAMQRAARVLRDHSIERVALERERASLVEQLHKQSNTDFLTGLPNRRAFFDGAGPLMHNLRRRGHRATLAVFDIDHFKRVNDVHGHAVGDAVLAAIAELCQGLCRRGDLLARYGGEEFVLLMPRCALSDALHLLERLRMGIETLAIRLPGGGVVRVTSSFGAADRGLQRDSLDELFAAADRALYRAKQLGRNRIELHDDAGLKRAATP